MKQGWSLHTVKRCWRQPAVIDFIDWLRDKAEAYESMHVSQNKSQPEDTSQTGFHKPTKKILPMLQKFENHFMLRTLSVG